MTISCIIPTKDRKALVLRAIESALNQSEAVSEVIVVDDGSTDGTSPAIRERFPKVKVVNTGGVGPGLARNKGVSVAQGEFLMFLDSDDQWLSNHTSALMPIIGKGYHVAYGITKNFDTISRPETEFFIPDHGCEIQGDCFKALVKWCFLVPSSVCVTREAFERAGGFEDGVLGEDWVFFIRLSAMFPFGFAPEIITIRTLHSEGLCHISGQHENILNVLRMVAKAAMESGRAGPEDIS
ncbi:MAG: glycosyltransferase family 2 protein, partial [Dissulfurimicrobium sp.]